MSLGIALAITGYVLEGVGTQSGNVARVGARLKKCGCLLIAFDVAIAALMLFVALSQPAYLGLPRM